MQAKHFIMAAAIGAVGLLAGTAVQAEELLEGDSTLAQPETSAESELPGAVDQDAAGTSDVADTEPLECPPGQFPSAFADVYPFHWAYQAVNNLASPNMQCFDLPEEYR